MHLGRRGSPPAPAGRFRSHPPPGSSPAATGGCKKTFRLPTDAALPASEPLPSLAPPRVPAAAGRPEYGGGPAGCSAPLRPRQEGVRIPHPPFTEVARHSLPVFADLFSVFSKPLAGF